MTAVIWPFQPRLEMIEVLEWVTNVLRAKRTEQRISVRRIPQRTFQLQHLLTDYQYSYATALIRDAQVERGFLVPDWGQSHRIGAVPSGSSVVLDVDLSYTDMLDKAILWESLTKYEEVEITNDSNGVVLTSVSQSYSDARLMPLWECEAPEGLSAQRMAGRLTTASIAMVVDGGNNLAVQPPAGYRYLDVMTDCPIVGSGTLEEFASWPMSVFGNSTTILHTIRNKSTPDIRSTMSWNFRTDAEKYAFRVWLHYRRGRQTAFWLSSFGQDLEPAASITNVSVVLRVFTFPNHPGLGRDEEFDIEIKTTTASYYRHVTGYANGVDINGRSTLEITIDSALGVNIPLATIQRISYLRCTRLDADRIELLHKAGEGMSVRIPVTEIPAP